MLRADAATGRPAGHMRSSAAAPALMKVMLDAARCHHRHLQLLMRPDHSQVVSQGQVRPAPAPPGRAVVNHLIGFCPGHRRSRRARLLSPAPPAALAPPLALRRHPPRQVNRQTAASTNSRYCGPGGAADPGPPKPAPPGPPAAPRSPRPAPRSPRPGQRTTRIPGQEAAARSQDTMIKAGRL